MFPPFTPTIAFLSIISPSLSSPSSIFLLPLPFRRITIGYFVVEFVAKFFYLFNLAPRLNFILMLTTNEKGKNENIRELIIKFEQCLHIRDCIYIILRVHHSFPSFSMARFKLLVRIRVDHFSRVSRVSGRSVIVKRLSILGEIVFGVYRKWVRRGWSSLAC